MLKYFTSRTLYLLGCGIFISQTSSITNGQEASNPAWWNDGTPPLISEGAENNSAICSVGQAKWMVSEALRGLTSALPGLAAEVRTDLDGRAEDKSDRIVDLSVPDPKNEEWIEQQKAALTIGQLKALADPFYRKINAVNSAWLTNQRVTNQTNHTNSIFPWTSETDDDANSAIATIGQLKSVFALRFSTLDTSGGEPTELDSDGDGLPDEWEMIHFGNLDQGANGNPDGDDFTNLEEYLFRFNPNEKSIGIDIDQDGWLDHQEVYLQGNTEKKDNPLVGLKVFIW